MSSKLNDLYYKVRKEAVRQYDLCPDIYSEYDVYMNYMSLCDLRKAIREEVESTCFVLWKLPEELKDKNFEFSTIEGPCGRLNIKEGSEFRVERVHQCRPEFRL